MPWARLLAALALPVLLAACTRQETPPAAAPSAAVATTSHELGRRIYNFRCYFCHGYSGNAQTLASTYLEPRPRDFTATAPASLARERMLESITNGRPGTAMRGFRGILSNEEIAAVTDFVRQEFMVDRAANTRYHTRENGWADHERYSAAFPFATGKLKIDTPPEQLTPEQRAGRALFMSTCISCHDRAHVQEPGAPWDARPLSFPRNGFTPGDAPSGTMVGAPNHAVDAISSATPYHLHDAAPKLAGLTAQEARGQDLFQSNCAFCHAADGTARNWIGSFLEPHPRDLTADANMRHMTPSRLAGVIREGLPGTSMPAWKSVFSDSQVADLVAYINRAFHRLAPEAPAASAK